jgi:hypothetical protein
MDREGVDREQAGRERERRPDETILPHCTFLEIIFRSSLIAA